MSAPELGPPLGDVPGAFADQRGERMMASADSSKRNGRGVKQTRRNRRWRERQQQPL
jgi:hypothetical protein